MATLSDIQLDYKLELQDLGSLLEEVGSGTEVRDEAIKDAIRLFSQKVPQKRTVLIAADATTFYAVPSDWIDGTSRIVCYEFPLDQQPPIYYWPDAGRWIEFQNRETGLFYHLDPNPTGQYRLTYTAPHKLDATTLAEAHVRLVALLAVSMSALKFAGRYANTVDNNVDAINYRSKEQEWHKVAKEKRDQYHREARNIEWREFTTRGENWGKVRGWRT